MAKARKGCQEPIRDEFGLGKGVRNRFAMNSVPDTFSLPNQKGHPMPAMPIKGCHLNRHRTNALALKIKAELFRQQGIEGNPKRGLLFDKAWERSHPGGHRDVNNYALDLIRDEAA